MIDFETQVRHLLHAINKFPKESNIILIMRHSQRKQPENRGEIPKLDLTPQGRKMARKFGKRLPKYRPIRLFHSPFKRCGETAELILEEFKKGSGRGLLKGPLKTLYGPGASLSFYIIESMKRNGEQFIFRWAAGLYSDDMIKPFIPYCQNTERIIFKNINDAPPKCIDIYVTHDIFLMSLRFGWFGYPPNEKWVSFLGGMAFTLMENCILLFDIDEMIHADIPFRWKNKK